ncbi:MAG TPA: pitrilysin family protein [Gemmataceae bacterium]
MQADIHQHTFANGLTLLAERMEHVRSAAFNFLVPAGCVYDPPNQLGMGTVLSDLLTRGAGPRDSRQLTFDLDNLGLDRGEGVGLMHMHLWGATVARNLSAALDIYADILRRPHLPEDELPAVQALAHQDLRGLEDEPRSKVSVVLRKHLYPTPLSNDRRGTDEGIDHITSETVRRHHQKWFQPDGAILSVAGNIQWQPLRDQVERLFADWNGSADRSLRLGPQPPRREHVAKDLEQTQITLAYPSVPIGHPDYYAALGAVYVLSSPGGMSSRLFTEIREKRGLCYSVSAGHDMLKDRANIVAYAGTTNERAQETLDVLLSELHRLQEGIEVEEVERIQAGIKSGLIMQQESTRARASFLASDWYYLNRVRSHQEIQSAIDGLSPAVILDHVRRYPPREFVIVTLGPKPLKC